MITDRDVDTLELLLTYGYLMSSQVRARLYPTDKDGSLTRTRLRGLAAQGFVEKLRAEVAVLTSSTAPAYRITERGVAHLALRRDDPKFLAMLSPTNGHWQNNFHYVCVSGLMMTVADAVTRQERVKMSGMCFEHTLLNPDEELPEKKFKLYQLIRETPKKCVCAPDAGFQFEVDDVKMGFFVELERGTDTPLRVSAKKVPGYAGMAETGKWERIFPEAQGFRVLVVAPAPGWRDALRKAVRGKPQAELWRFAAQADLTPETFLHSDVWFDVEGGARPLIRPSGPPRREK